MASTNIKGRVIMNFYKVSLLITITVLSIFFLIGYFYTKDVTVEKYTEISAEQLSKMFSEDFQSSQPLLGGYYIIDGTVDDNISFQGDKIVLLNGGIYPQIYVKGCIREKGNRVQIRCKLTEYTGALFAVTK